MACSQCAKKAAAARAQMLVNRQQQAAAAALTAARGNTGAVSRVGGASNTTDYMAELDALKNK